MMMRDILLKGGRVIDPASGLDAICDLKVSHGRIATIGAAASAGDA